MADESIIKKTKDYNIFTYIIGNRPVVPGHVAKLTTKILQKNMLAQNPMIVVPSDKPGKFGIVNGQHRLEVAKNNNLDIYYIVVEGIGLEEVISLNTDIRIWKLNDLINSYASQGKKDYLWLSEFLENYGLSPSQGLVYLFGNEGNAARVQLTKGKLNLTEEQKAKAETRADVLWTVRPYMIRSGFIPRAFFMELMEATDAGLGPKIVKGLKARGTSIMASTERKEARTQIRALV